MIHELTGDDNQLLSHKIMTLYNSTFPVYYADKFIYA